MTMLRLTFCIAITLIAQQSAATSGGRHALYGLWGDARQCTRAMIQNGGTVRAEPMQIAEGWLQQGTIWCRLTWFPVQARAGGLFVSARALCGEDSALDYRLDMVLDGDELSLIWDETLMNGPMRRCVARE